MKLNFQKQKGASLLLTLLILVSVLAIALGVVALMMGELKMSQEVPKSLKAYYAAEAGIERALYDERRGGGAVDIGDPPDCDSGSGAVCLSGSEVCYSIDAKTTGSSTTITSYGCYKGTRRAIDVSWEY